MEGFSDSDLVMAKVHGFRSWQFGKKDHGLIPLTDGLPYTTRNNVATCFRESYHDEHQPPVRSCGCGIWAYWSLPSPAPRHVRGVVAASGRMLLGTKGFRAERADIVALLAPWWRPRLRRRLRVRYGDVPFYTSTRRLVRHHRPDVEELVPEALVGVHPMSIPLAMTLWLVIANWHLVLDLIGVHVAVLPLVMLTPITAGFGGYALGRRAAGRTTLPVRAHHWWRRQLKKRRRT